jgi:predicted RecB family nuclease
MDTKITRDILYSYLQCKFKGCLKLRGRTGTKSDYEILLRELHEEFKLRAIDKILTKHKGSRILQSLTATRPLLKQGAAVILDAVMKTDFVSLHVDGLKMVSGASHLGSFHYVPILFHQGEKIREEQKLMIALYSVVLGTLQGRQPDKGLGVHGQEYRVATVRLNSHLRSAQRILEEIRRIHNAGIPPKLMLNKHCHVCEFQQPCYVEATNKDDISLLRGMSEKEIKKQNSKGIFTTTQLSCTFRPRKKAMRVKQHHHPYYFALQALAIREKKTYVFGIPDLPTSAVRIYFDIEGDPERSFVYLLRMIIDENGSEKRYSLWADDKAQEAQLFHRFLDIIDRYDDFCLFHYGSYESVFLKRMRNHAERKKPIDKVINKSFNILSIIHSNIYFPAYSKGLKDIGQYLGCTWTEETASGIQSIVWRKRWETIGNEELKRKLMIYNSEDCAALKRIIECIYAISTESRQPHGSQAYNGRCPEIAWVHDLKAQTTRREWGTPSFFYPEFDYINKCAYFDYQREKIFIRDSKTSKRMHAQKRKTERVKKLRVSRRMEIKSLKCPYCAGTKMTRYYKRMHSKLAFDLTVTSSGIRRQVIECTAALHRCLGCQKNFLPRKYKKRDKHFHALKSWAMYQHIAHRISFQNLEEMFRECFGLQIDYVMFHLFKSLLAKYYCSTYKNILKKIITGSLIHADETAVNLQKGKGYVWAFTNLEEVVFLYKPTREGDFVQELLKDYKGVLISDFYGAYDSIACTQQKCLIHLMRDFNHDLLDNPYDDEFKSLAYEFGHLLRIIVSTIDQYGLRHRHLNKHKKDVKQFYSAICKQDYQSELAERYQRRLMKYRNKLFTFLNHDGVPWNNNNAEHSIRHFANYRVITNGKMTETGLNDYLVLLSIYQTCRYKGISFLKFLLSRERDIDGFCERGSKRRRILPFDVYPEGYPKIYRKPHSKHDKL